MFAQLISMQRFKSIIFYQNSSKIVIFAKKCKNFRALGLRPQTSMPPAAVGFAPRPPASGGWGLSSWTSNGFGRLRSQTSKTAPPQSRIFGCERLNVV